MKKPVHRNLFVRGSALLALTISLAGCGNGSWWANDDEPKLESNQIKKLIFNLRFILIGQFYLKL